LTTSYYTRSECNMICSNWCGYVFTSHIHP